MILHLGATRRSDHFTGGERTQVPTEEEAGWAPQTVWTFWRTEKSIARIAIRSPDPAARSLITTLITLRYKIVVDVDADGRKAATDSASKV